MQSKTCIVGLLYYINNLRRDNAPPSKIHCDSTNINILWIRIAIKDHIITRHYNAVFFMNNCFECGALLSQFLQLNCHLLQEIVNSFRVETGFVSNTTESHVVVVAHCNNAETCQNRVTTKSFFISNHKS